MNISNYSKAEVLATLFNAAKPLGLGRLHYRPDHIMSVQEAQAMLDSGQTFFDYVEGRLMKVGLDKDELDTYEYNLDHGENAAENALKSLEK